MIRLNFYTYQMIIATLKQRGIEYMSLRFLSSCELK